MKKFGTNSMILDGKPCPMDEFFKSMSMPKGKWFKLEAYYKVKQRSNKVLVDELKLTKVK